MEAKVLFKDPPIAQLLFADPRLAWLWLPLRVWLGWQWLDAGMHKFSDPKWMETGVALQGFWQRAVTIPAGGKPVAAYDWYRDFLQLLLEGGHHVWFAKLVVLGEMAIGVGLLLGAFTGVAAFFGMFLNWHFVMAGTPSTNAMLMVVGMFIVMGWKTAGWIGLDRWLLPMVGTPWQAGKLAPHANDTQHPAGPPQQQPLTS